MKKDNGLQLDSETTQSQADVPKSIGPGPITHGSEVALPERTFPLDVALELQAKNVDRMAILSLEQSSGFVLAEICDTDWSLKDFDIRGNPTQIDLKDMKEKLNPFIKPASDEEVLKALLKCRASKASRNQSDGDLDFTIETYVELAREYPGDAVLQAIYESMTDPTQKWFPEWPVFLTRIEFLAEKRLVLRKAIDRKLKRGRVSSAINNAVRRGQ